MIVTMFWINISHLDFIHYNCLSSAHGEQPLYKAQAVVMSYDYSQKTWVPVDGKDGVSKLYILHNAQTNMYRVVGRRQNDSEV